MTRPTIAITMGDPAGIGPEVIMKALAQPEVLAICNPLVIGDANRLRKAGEIVGGRSKSMRSAMQRTRISRPRPCSAWT